MRPADATHPPTDADVGTVTRTLTTDVDVGHADVTRDATRRSNIVLATSAIDIADDVDDRHAARIGDDEPATIARELQAARCHRLVPHDRWMRGARVVTADS